MKPFVVNSHGRLVFPSNFSGEIDFSVLESLDQLTAVVKRDFEAKAPTGTELAERAQSGAYAGRYELLRDMALNLCWSNRYAMTMYEKRPTRWCDVPRRRDDVFLPVFTPWEEGQQKVATIAAALEGLSPTYDADVEERILGILFDVFRHKLHHATDLPPMKPTVAEMLAQPESLTYCISAYEPDYPVFTQDEILDCSETVPELEALHRLVMVLHNQYPWDRGLTRLEEVGRLKDDDFVVAYAPRNPEVLAFIRRVRSGRPPRPRFSPGVEARQPVRPFHPIIVHERFTLMPRLASLAVVKGEHECTNEDVVRNAAFSWSAMSAEEISQKTGIEARRYTEHELEEISLAAAAAALTGAGRRPEEIGAVLFCTCTSTRLIPSVATWISGQLGIHQTQGSFDLIAACAGFPYGLTEAVRIMQDVERPVLVVCAEKFSDKVGSVRPSRMIFGDGAAALVIEPAPDGAPTDIEVLQTYASGPFSQVNSIIWPNPEFDNDITVWGPEVKALVERYLEQMMGELGGLALPDGDPGSLIGGIDLVVPHQANKNMVVELAVKAGIAPDNLYFNIEKVGNVSAASIPLAIYDATVEGVIDRPMRVFAPGFGAGAVAGYAVMRIDPEVVVRKATHVAEAVAATAIRDQSWEDMLVAFGG